MFTFDVVHQMVDDHRSRMLADAEVARSVPGTTRTGGRRARHHAGRAQALVAVLHRA